MSEPPRLLDRMREAIRTRHYGRRTEEAYIGWVKRFIFFHNKKHPAAMGADEVNAFLTHLAVERRVSASTQSQALCALIFLYRHVLDDPLRWMDEIVRAQRRERLPLVLDRDEVRRLLGAMEGTPRLVASVLYGGGLRLLEALRLRVKDVDFAAKLIVVRQGKGDKDRRTLLPESLAEPLRRQIEHARRMHQKDLRVGLGAVWLPDALAKKYPNAPREFGWQWIFPATRLWTDPVNGARGRHHLDESVIQKAVRKAVIEAQLDKPAACHVEAQFRDASARRWIRHPNGAGAARSCRCSNDNDLHACTAADGAASDAQPARPARRERRVNSSWQPKPLAIGRQRHRLSLTRHSAGFTLDCEGER